MIAKGSGFRVAVTGLVHESNSFAPNMTTRPDFEDAAAGGIRRGLELQELRQGNTCVAGFWRFADSYGWTVIPTFHAQAEPGGVVESGTFSSLVGELIQSVFDSSPDAIYVDLHGAMISEHCDDADAYLIEQLRDRLGPEIPIVASLDLHANVSPRILSAATALVAYRTYPHVDMAQTGVRAGDLLASYDERGFQTYHRYLDFMMPVNRQNTNEQPMNAVYEALASIEHRLYRDGLLSLSLTTGFQPADVKAPVPAVFAIARDKTVAQAAVDELAAYVSAHEAAFSFDYVSATKAAKIAKAHDGPRSVILADAQDNPGGGGSSDTMFLTHALLAAGLRKALVGIIHDPEAARAAHASGVGTVISIDLGGGSIPGDEPLHAAFTVQALSTEPVFCMGPMHDGMAVDLGKAALLHHRGLDILVGSKRTQCLDRAFFRHFGVEPADYPVIVLKSAVHFQADFQPITERVVDVIAPGFEAMDFTRLPYSKLATGIRFYGCGPAHSEPGEPRRLSV